MNLDIRKKWVEALRSGKYTQADGALCKIQGDKCTHCCLGVLLDICDVKKSNDSCLDRYTYYYGNSRSWYRLPTDFRIHVGLNEIDASHLAALNDDGIPFTVIADHIEHNNL